MWERYVNNPAGRSVGDCAVRAVAKALGLTWDEAYIKLTVEGFTIKDMPSSNAVIGILLKENGFEKKTIPNTCPDCYTLEDFAHDHPQGVYVVFTSGHVVTAENGKICDSWDSSNEIPIYYFEKGDMQDG